jgi:hypothetical protein
MKGRYINTKILLACLSTSRDRMKDVHTELRETIAEHKRIMKQLTKIFFTIENDEVIMHDKKAA